MPQRRMRWEPIYEVTQMKGDGEAHPALSPTDEFADFETWDKGSFGPGQHARHAAPRIRARSAQARLTYEAKLGANPFKFGMVGSTDSHTALSTSQEDNFFGKVALLEPSADPSGSSRWSRGAPVRTPRTEAVCLADSASGLAAVWAPDNTREALWDAMARKEVYATTGTRLLVRVFAGFDFVADDCAAPRFRRVRLQHGRAHGRRPLGRAAREKSPAFVIRALRDVDGANLDRIQIVKGWIDAPGRPQEKVYDVAWSGDRKPGPTASCRRSATR